MSENLPDPSAASPAPAPVPAPAPGVTPAQPVPGRAWVAAALLLLALSVVALALAWKTDRRVAALEQELVRRQQDSARQATEAQMLAKQASENVGAASAKVALLEARVAEVALQRTQLEDLIQSLSRSRDENLLVDIEAALRMAMQQGAITGSTEPLVLVLRQSDERLARYSQPRLEGVRRAIKRDLDRVRSAGALDIASLTSKIDESMRIVDDLPLLASAEPLRERGPQRAPAAVGKPAVAASASALGLWPAAWSELWHRGIESAGEALRSLVRVTRIEHPDAALLAPDQAYFVRENLKLKLLNARLALLSRQFPTAQADLQTAQQTIERYFDSGSRRTTAALELLRQVGQQARQTTLPRPDDTLAALATAAAGR